MQGEDFIKRSAALRGQKSFKDAIDLIEKNLHKIDKDIHVNAYLEIFNAAVEAKDETKAKEAAKKIAEDHPKLPSIQPYLE
jgi:hypothetical protein